MPLKEQQIAQQKALDLLQVQSATIEQLKTLTQTLADLIQRISSRL